MHLADAISLLCFASDSFMEHRSDVASGLLVPAFHMQTVFGMSAEQGKQASEASLHILASLGQAVLFNGRL
jgi:hypothetical protein